ncbi:MAG: endonuclease Q family protein [Chitinivibrionales bacterium]
MHFYADFHIHSRFSRATSPRLDLEHLFVWAQLKGIGVVGTGDFVHPAWLDELREKLIEAEPGLFALKKAVQKPLLEKIPPRCRAPVRFILVTEISNIYKRYGKVRKVHNLIFAPSFTTARRIQKKLAARGNISSDGRPILGLDSRDLLYIVLETDPFAFLVPAHIWTPWFSVLGARSGFDSLEQCYGELSRYVFAVETGLSSDPPMNRLVSGLDRCSLISCSDAHSPIKLGREATIFSTEPDYFSIRAALEDPKDPGLVGTVEFFAQQGKYYLDGHRKCGFRQGPHDSPAVAGVCPVCGKTLTEGVLSRVKRLADRKESESGVWDRCYESLISLSDIVAQAEGVGSTTKRVCGIVQSCYRELGNELEILRAAPLGRIEDVAGRMIAEGVGRMREGRVHIDAGYDGQFGEVRLFTDKDLPRNTPRR